jgi:HAE1 family hydrophobic/amphiphilic exporter-1
MNLPAFSVRRPVFTSMVTLMVVILGAVSLSRIRIDLLPTVEMPTVSIRTGFSGASPEVMERLITQMLEEIVATVPGVEEISSSSSEGSSNIRVTFIWGTDINTAALDLQSRIEDEINELPDDVVRPRINKFDINSFPVVLLGISSTLDPVEMTELIENQVRYRFARVPGVAQVDLWGGFQREIRIELDPDRVKALGVPLDRIITAVRNANLDLPAGRIEQGRYEVTLRAPAEYTSLDEIRQTVIERSGDTVVTIGQVATVRDTYERISRIVRVNGQRGLHVGIRKQADANTVEVSRRVLEEIEAVNAAFPQIRVVPVINQGNFIERSIANVTQSVLYGGGLAIVILLFFLRNVRSTLVISMAIPISVVATFALIYFGGFTLNLMTLGGLALGVGMMVDSSVVVLENIFRRHREQGEAVAEAAVRGAREVGPAIVASTLTTLVVFLPLIFVRGVAGVLFKDLAFVVMFSLFCSLMVSISLVPMLAAYLIRPHGPGDPGLHPRAPWIDRLVERSESILDGLDTHYRNLLRRVLRHPALTVGGAVAALAASLLLLPFIGSEFLPPSDEGEVRVNGEMEVGTRLELVDRQSRRMEELVFAAVPEAVSSVVSVRSGEADIRIRLTPAAERARANTEIAEALRELLAGAVPGMEIRVRAPQGQFLLDRLLGGDQGITVEVRGFELDILDALARRVADAIEDVSGITDIDTSREVGIPQQEIRVDRAKLADLGLSVRDVTRLVETAIAGSQAGDYRADGHSYRILIQLQDAERRSLDEVLDLTLTTPSGEAVALRNVVETAFSRGPSVIDRNDQQRQVAVEANVAGRDLGSVAQDVQARLRDIPRPLGYDLNVAGNYEEQQESFRDLRLSLLLALVFVYMVLACQYESLKNPLVVILSVPFATIGVLVVLFATRTTLNLQSYIGCIMLGGIVVNNAILLVDQAAQLGRRGMPIPDAIAEAGRRRLRPILMTTLTTILALMPLALGIGEGADAQAPLARAVVGGLTGSTLITLVLIPAVYSLFHSDPEGEHG